MYSLQIIRVLPISDIWLISYLHDIGGIMFFNSIVNTILVIILFCTGNILHSSFFSCGFVQTVVYIWAPLLLSSVLLFLGSISFYGFVFVFPEAPLRFVWKLLLLEKKQ